MAAYNHCVGLEPRFYIPRSLATWAFAFLWLGCFLIGSLFFLDPMAHLHIIDVDTAEGLGMGIGLTLAPLCFVISALLAAWHLVRKWTGTEQPSIKLGLAEERRSAGEQQDD